MDANIHGVDAVNLPEGPASKHPDAGSAAPDRLALCTRADDAPIAVIVGNEGAGIRPQLNALSTKRVAIPLSQGAESLNVAVAAGILLYEVLRGR